MTLTSTPKALRGPRRGGRRRGPRPAAAQGRWHQNAGVVGRGDTPLHNYEPILIPRNFKLKWRIPFIF